MRVLQVGAGDFFSTYGGGQVYVKNLVDEMIRQGSDVAVLSFVAGKGGAKYLKKDYRGIDLYEVETADMAVLKSIVSEIKPDVIHAHSHKGAICNIGRSMGIPVVVTAHHGGIVCPAGALMNCRDGICREKADFKKCLPCVLRNIRTGLYWHPFISLLSEEKYVRLGRWMGKKRFIPFVSPIGMAGLSIRGKANEWNDIAKGASLVIAPCYELGEALVRNGLDSDRLEIVPHGIKPPVSIKDESRCKELQDKEMSCVTSYLEDDGLHFFYVGRICYVKGIHILIKAFMEVKNPDVRLHLIGGSGNNTERRYEARMRKLSASDNRIIWHGKVAPEEVYDMTEQFEISISPSICMEAYGLNVAEAMALGKPVLATKNGGAEMQIKEGVNGWLVEPNDVEALREKIEWLANERPELDPETVKDFVKGIEEHVNELNDLYSRIADDVR